MTAVFERVAVIGLGLLGGSVARAAKSSGAARSVAGATRRRAALDQALSSGAVDAVGSPEEAVQGTGLVVLATPVYAMAEMLRRIAPQLEPGALITDVGSVKALLHETLPGLLPPGVGYIGSHPMAGGHERGFERARADLFRGAACVVTETEATPDQIRLCDFWRSLGARVVLRTPTAHDAEVAWMSHVPHVLAYAFAEALESAPSGAEQVGGAGFRDFTRIARSEPELWGDILTANGKALAAPLQAVASAVAQMGRAIEAGDTDALERTFSAGRDTLSRFSPVEDREGTGAGEGHPSEGEPTT